MTATTTTPKFGYPTWLAMLAAVVGAFAAIAGLGASVAEIIESSEDSGVWALLMLTDGVVLLLGLVLVRRAPLASVILLALGGLGFGALSFWMVITVVIGIVIAIGAALSAPRVLRARSSA